MSAGPRFLSMDMLTVSDEVEAKCTGHQRRGSLWYVKVDFENRHRLAFQAELIQCPSSPCWHQPRKGTSQTFMMPQVVKKRENCTIISLPRYKSCMSLKG